MTVDYSATRCKLSLPATRDSVTGWRDPVTWDTSETLDPIEIVGRGMAKFHTPAGYTGKIDYLARCADPIEEGDHIIWNTQRYHVEYVKPEWKGDNFEFYESALTYLPYFEESAASATWETTPHDTRYRTKAFIEHVTKGVVASAITKNDGTTLAAYATIWENPPNYHLKHEYRAATSPVQGLYVIGEPTEEPLVDETQHTYAYKASVPIHVCTMDSTGCGGEQLKHKMEAELQRIMETYPISSMRMPSGRSAKPIMLGSDRLYKGTWILSYERDTQT